MQDVNAVDVIAAAIVVPVVSLIAVWFVRRCGRWFINALIASFAETVRDVVAGDLARLGTRLGTSVDELRVANAAEHTEVQGRLGAVEARLSDVERRLASVESTLHAKE